MSNIVLTGIPQDLDFSIESKLFPYQNCRSAIFQGFLPFDSSNSNSNSNSSSGQPSVLISTRFGESSQVHNIKTPLGYRRQLTFFPDPVANVTPCPSASSPFSKCFLFLMAIGGSEKYQLFVFDNAQGKFFRLTNQNEMRFLSPTWSKNGERIAFCSNKRNGKDTDVYVASLRRTEAGEYVLVDEKLVTSESGMWTPYDFSHDGNSLLVKEYVSASNSVFYTVNLKSMEMTRLQTCSGEAHYGSGQFCKDSNLVIFACDLGKEFSQLHCFDIKKQQIVQENIIKKDWDVVDIELDSAGAVAMCVVNEDGFFQLYHVDLSNFTVTHIPMAKSGIISSCGFDQSGRFFGLTLSNAQTAGDVYVLDTEANFACVRWTESEIGGLNAEKFVLPDLIHFPTFDNRQIPAFYYHPKKGTQNSTGAKKRPVLIYIHGGPESQFLPSFIWKFQFYVLELGISVIAPNVRGSNGYGRSYLALDDKMLRHNSVKDIGSLIDWCRQQDDIDPDRICVEGGSYGGFMVLASMINFIDKLRTGMEIVGISNFVTFLENTSEYRRDIRREEYGDERDPEMRKYLLEISPTTNASKITKPMLIAQGANDPRVPESESFQIVKEIRQNNVDCWYILAKDEGHGFVKKSNIDLYTKHQMLFLQRHLIN